MRERTVKIGSAGKMFGLTGWKVGFVCAAPELTGVLARAHQFLTFTTPPNLQTAVAWGLDEAGDWFETMPAGLQRSRDRLTRGAARRRVSRCCRAQGTYFLKVDLAASGVAEDDMAFCLRAVKEAGVAAIPLCAFYETDAPTNCPPVLRQVRRDPGRRGSAARQGAGAFASGGDGELTLAKWGAFLSERCGRA